MSGATVGVTLLDRHDDPGFDALVAALETAGGAGRLVYALNPGNWGDALVHAGALQLFGRLRREVRVVVDHDDLEDRRPDDVLVVAGAGSWSATDRSARDLVERWAPRFAHTVVLPTTYELGAVDLAPSAVSYFRRDDLLSTRTVPGSTFAPDLAFHVRLTLELPPPLPEVRSYGATAAGVAPAWHRPGHADVSRRGTARSSVTSFLRLVGRSSSVRTDRLHVAIAAALLGRDTALYGRRHGKAHAVFDATLSSYPHVHFHDLDALTSEAQGQC